jgi:hypothetical protein
MNTSNKRRKEEEEEEEKTTTPTHTHTHTPPAKANPSPAGPHLTSLLVQRRGTEEEAGTHTHTQAKVVVEEGKEG